MKLEHMTSHDVDALDRETIFVVPVESLEQHSIICLCSQIRYAGRAR